MHKLLKLQLRKHLGIQDPTDLPAELDGLRVQAQAAGMTGRILQSLPAFIEQVDAAYAQFDRDVSLAHRGLVLSNQELVSLYEQQRVELERRERSLATLRASARELAGIEAPEGSEDDLEALSELVSRLVKERQEAKDALVQAKKLESLGVLAGGIAHDFNNLLVAIGGNLEMALLRLEPDHPVRPFLERMEPAAQRSADIVRQLLDYAGKGRLQFQSVDLNTLIREVESLLPPRALQACQHRRSLAPEPLPVRGDASQLVQGILNLMLNALDAMGSGGGTLTVRSQAVHLDAEALNSCQVAEGPPGVYAAVHIADSGCGMDEATRQRIFDPFFSTKAQGRGLGLAVLHGVLRNHGGAARIESEPGLGTTFSLYLPICEALKEIRPTATPLHEGDATRRILVVDDEAPNRGVVCAFLEALGYASGEADSGPEALSLHTELPFDAFLMDLSMPGMDGAETLTKLRQWDTHVPVILMSGFSEELSKTRLEGLKVAGFLQKPFKLKELGETLGKALRS